MNLVEGQCAPGEIEWNEAANRKKEKKGERRGRGREERKMWEWGNEGLHGDSSFFCDSVAKWHGTTYLAQFFSSGSMSSSLCINAQSPFPLLCTMLLPLDLMIYPWEPNRSHNHFFLFFYVFSLFCIFWDMIWEIIRERVGGKSMLALLYICQIHIEFMKNNLDFNPQNIFLERDVKL